jgi:spore coat protein U-like protein
MTAGTADLDYNLYSDAARLIVWGDGVSASDVSASGTSVDLPIYGRIPARQNVKAGVYVDTITITVSY